jgi:hypothetical protein
MHEIISVSAIFIPKLNSNITMSGREGNIKISLKSEDGPDTSGSRWGPMIGFLTQ